MFAAASRREFDCLLFWSLDRLSREGTVETLNHLQRLTGYGVNYRSFTEQYLDSTGVFKEAVIGILAAVAKQERVRLSERTIAGLERARAQGGVGHVLSMILVPWRSSKSCGAAALQYDGLPVPWT
jgi:DNA invertase Pin-like site-specific DNA recombinase